MSVLFISDLHLSPERPAVTRAFLVFLRDRASQAEALYVLGDLFEAWIGDDDTGAIVRPPDLGVAAIDHLPSPLHKLGHGHVAGSPAATVFFLAEWLVALRSPRLWLSELGEAKSRRNRSTRAIERRIQTQELVWLSITQNLDTVLQ